MSYLNLPSINLADFKKGTISLWFRVSEDSVLKARQHSAGYRPPNEDAPAVFRATIPFITFGRSVTAHCWGSEIRLDGSTTVGTPPVTYTAYSPHPVPLADAPCPPSHIGLDCLGGHVFLVMFFQTETWPQVQGLLYERTEVHWEPIDPSRPTVLQMYQTVQDVSYARMGQQGSFLINPDFEVALDEWHHVLVSFDFSSSVDVVALQRDPHLHNRGDSVQSTCKFWYAFDDENKSGQDNMGNAWAYRGPNDVISQQAMEADDSYIPFNSPFVTGGDENPEYHLPSSPVPMNHGAVGLPASAQYVETIYHCEMAELQFFAGLQVDTGDVNIRRAFVDSDGRPVPPARTEELLGRRPDILLHKSSNWQAGKNTGSTGVSRTDEGDQIIASGQFIDIGLIKKYKPDPRLEESTA